MSPANDNSALAATAGMAEYRSLHRHVDKLSKAASLQRFIDRKFRIDAHATDPRTRTGYERDNIHDYCLVRNIELAFDQAVLYLEHGYWVEVYDDGNDMLLAGPFDPNDLPPTLINFIGGGVA